MLDCRYVRLARVDWNDSDTSGGFDSLETLECGYG
jgi:hypothetical protein